MPVLAPPEVHLFVLWAAARHAESRIFVDLEARFTVLDVVEVRWTGGAAFARNLTRMYGEALPAGSDKERHCGAGPFLAVVVEDRAPRYRLRRTRRGVRLLNVNVLDARQRYRDWTGGGYRVHASDSVAEAERHLVLVLGEGRAAFRSRRPSSAVRHRADPDGTDGWTGLDALLRALRVHGAVPDRSAEPMPGLLTVRASDGWWAEQVAGGIVVGDGVREVMVAGCPLRLTVLKRPSTPIRLASGVRGLGRRHLG